jgi:hypothetical protein
LRLLSFNKLNGKVREAAIASRASSAWVA